MKFLSLTSAAALTTLMAAHAASAADSMDATMYVENTTTISLYETQKIDGRDVLVSKVTLPEESTLSANTVEMTRQLELQITSPEQVNFAYQAADKNGRMQILKSKKGWVCGISIVDVVDEEMREDDLMDRQYCVSNAQWSNLKPLESNGPEALDAMTKFQSVQDISALSNLSRAVEMNRLEVTDIADLAAMGSPLKNCGAGCLKVNSGFGMRKHPVLKKKRLHKGLDLRASTGTQAVAVYGGKILANRQERNRKSKKLKGYGNYVIVVHSDYKLQTLYAHLSKFSGKPGQKVERGDVIALTGATGIGTGPHLHFEVHTASGKGYKPQNPRPFLSTLISGLQDVMSKLGMFWS